MNTLRKPITNICCAEVRQRSRNIVSFTMVDVTDFFNKKKKERQREREREKVK